MEHPETAASAPRPRKTPARKADPVPTGRTRAKSAAAKPTAAKPPPASKTTSRKTAESVEPKPRRAAAATATRAATTTTAVPDKPRPPRARKAAAPVAAPPPAEAPQPSEPQAAPQPSEPQAAPQPSEPQAARQPSEPTWSSPPTGRPRTSPLTAAGSRAREWVDRVHERYPGAGPDAIARLAATEFSRSAARAGAATSTVGLLGSVGATGVIAHEQAGLVLVIAYAYGHDPTAPERADEIIDILRLPRPAQGLRISLRNAAGLAAGVAIRRAAGAVIPFGASLAGAVQGGRAAQDVARRAVARYRGGSAAADQRKLTRSRSSV